MYAFSSIFIYFCSFFYIKRIQFSVLVFYFSFVFIFLTLKMAFLKYRLFFICYFLYGLVSVCFDRALLSGFMVSF